MAGIVFMSTKDLAAMKEHYIGKVGMELWLDQGDCAILRHGNLLLGFCQRDRAEDHGIITFFYESAAEVDMMHERLKATSVNPPMQNEKYCIYHFFASDPEGRMLEFQAFTGSVGPYLTADEVIRARRAVRAFAPDDVDDDTLWQALELARSTAEAAKDTPFYFIVVRNKEKMAHLAAVRGAASEPISAAPLAVAICADPERTHAPRQESCIAAYHFILAAWAFGLGTCWITGMDRPDVKRILGVPASHHVATVTPVGYPRETPDKPDRKSLEEMVKFLK